MKIKNIRGMVQLVCPRCRRISTFFDGHSLGHALLANCPNCHNEWGFNDDYIWIGKDDLNDSVFKKQNKCSIKKA